MTSVRPPTSRVMLSSIHAPFLLLCYSPGIRYSVVGCLGALIDKKAPEYSEAFLPTESLAT
jgi:hypothetical protein